MGAILRRGARICQDGHRVPKLRFSEGGIRAELTDVSPVLVRDRCRGRGIESGVALCFPPHSTGEVEG